MEVEGPGQALALGLNPRGGCRALPPPWLCFLEQIACLLWASVSSLTKGRRRLALNFRQLVGFKLYVPVRCY